MRHQLPILDIDRHVMEPMDMWLDYLPNRWRAFAPDIRPLSPPGETIHDRLERLGGHALLETPPVVTVGGKPICKGMTEIGHIEVGLHTATHYAALRAAETAGGHIAGMDASGIELAVLLPTFAGFLVFDDDIDAARSRAYASAYNRWLVDLCSEAPERLLPAAIMSRHEPAHMVDDLALALRAGHRAVVVRPNPVCGRTLGAPELEPFYAACEAADIPLLLHEGAHTRVETAGATRFTTHFAQHACSHPMEMMMGLLALLEGGVLERHPKLRVALLESGCSWLPYWLWRLDHVEFARLRNEVRGRINYPPSTYFRRQCWIALEPDEALLAPAIDAIGRDRVVFGTDFPHVDHDVDIVSQLLSDRAELGNARLGPILWDNAAALLGAGFDMNRVRDRSRRR